MNHAYASSLGDTLIRRFNPQLCIHGHLHHRLDYAYMYPGGTTCIHANPRGHAGENPRFDPHRILEI